MSLLKELQDKATAALEQMWPGGDKMVPNDAYIEQQILDLSLIAEYYDGLRVSTAAVARNKLWQHFGRFAKAIEGIDPPAEQFQPKRLPHPELRIYAIQGRKTLLAWCRDSKNTWQSELAEARAPRTVTGQSVALELPAGWSNPTVSVYDPWTDRSSPASIRAVTSAESQMACVTAPA